MATEWKVEGTGAKTKIIATCPVCHYTQTFLDDDGLGDHLKVIQRQFKHNLCNGLIENIPPEIRDLYWQRAVISPHVR